MGEVRGALPAPPRRSLAERAPDVLVWGGVLALLLVSARPVELGHVARLFANSENMREFAHGFLRPDFTDWRLYVAQMWLTVQIALWGTVLAVLIAVPFGLGCARNVSPPWLQQPLRLVMNLLRSIPDLLIGLIFIVAVGLGPFSGVMALALNTGGARQAVLRGGRGDRPRPGRGHPRHRRRQAAGTGLGVVPQVAPHWASFALYRFESNARSATVLGLIGAGGIGQLLFETLNAFQYAQLSAMVVVIVIAVSLIDLLSQAMRSRLI